MSDALAGLRNQLHLQVFSELNQSLEAFKKIAMGIAAPFQSSLMAVEHFNEQMRQSQISYILATDQINAWGQAMGDFSTRMASSRDQFKKLVQDIEIETQTVVGLTSSRLMNVMNEIIQESSTVLAQSKSGMSDMDLFKKLTGNLSATFSLLGSPQWQDPQEVRSLMMGRVNDPNSFVAQKLNISKGQADEAMAKGTYIDLLIEKTNAYREASTLAADSLSNVTSNFQELVEQIQRGFGGPLLQSVSKTVSELFSVISDTKNNSKKSKEISLNKATLQLDKDLASVRNSIEATTDPAAIKRLRQQEQGIQQQRDALIEKAGKGATIYGGSEFERGSRIIAEEANYKQSGKEETYLEQMVTIATNVGEALGKLFDSLSSLIGGIVSFAKSIGGLGLIKGGIAGVVSAIGIIANAINVVSGIINTISQKLSVFEPILSPIMEIVGSTVGTILTLVVGFNLMVAAVGRMRAAFTNASRAIDRFITSVDRFGRRNGRAPDTYRGRGVGRTDVVGGMASEAAYTVSQQAFRGNLLAGVVADTVMSVGSDMLMGSPTAKAALPAAAGSEGGAIVKPSALSTSVMPAAGASARTMRNITSATEVLSSTVNTAATAQGMGLGARLKAALTPMRDWLVTLPGRLNMTWGSMALKGAGAIGAGILLGQSINKYLPSVVDGLKTTIDRLSSSSKPLGPFTGMLIKATERLQYFINAFYEFDMGGLINSNADAKRAIDEQKTSLLKTIQGGVTSKEGTVTSLIKNPDLTDVEKMRLANTGAAGPEAFTAAQKLRNDYIDSYQILMAGLSSDDLSKNTILDDYQKGMAQQVRDLAKNDKNFAKTVQAQIESTSNRFYQTYGVGIEGQTKGVAQQFKGGFGLDKMNSLETTIDKFTSPEATARISPEMIDNDMKTISDSVESLINNELVSPDMLASIKEKLKLTFNNDALDTDKRAALFAEYNKLLKYELQLANKFIEASNVIANARFERGDITETEKNYIESVNKLQSQQIATTNAEDINAGKNELLDSTERGLRTKKSLAEKTKVTATERATNIDQEINRLKETGKQINTTLGRNTVPIMSLVDSINVGVAKTGGFGIASAWGAGNSGLAVTQDQKDNFGLVNQILNDNKTYKDVGNALRANKGIMAASKTDDGAITKIIEEFSRETSASVSYDDAIKAVELLQKYGDSGFNEATVRGSANMTPDAINNRIAQLSAEKKNLSQSVFVEPPKGATLENIKPDMENYEGVKAALEYRKGIDDNITAQQKAKDEAAKKLEKKDITTEDREKAQKDFDYASSEIERLTIERNKPMKDVVASLDAEIANLKKTREMNDKLVEAEKEKLKTIERQVMVAKVRMAYLDEELKLTNAMVNANKALAQAQLAGGKSFTPELFSGQIAKAELEKSTKEEGKAQLEVNIQKESIGKLRSAGGTQQEIQTATNKLTEAETTLLEIQNRKAEAAKNYLKAIIAVKVEEEKRVNRSTRLDANIQNVKGTMTNAQVSAVNSTLDYKEAQKELAEYKKTMTPENFNKLVGGTMTMDQAKAAGMSEEEFNRASNAVGKLQNAISSLYDIASAKLSALAGVINQVVSGFEAMSSAGDMVNKMGGVLWESATRGNDRRTSEFEIKSQGLSKADATRLKEEMGVTNFKKLQQEYEDAQYMSSLKRQRVEAAITRMKAEATMLELEAQKNQVVNDNSLTAEQKKMKLDALNMGIAAQRMTAGLAGEMEGELTTAINEGPNGAKDPAATGRRAIETTKRAGDTYDGIYQTAGKTDYMPTVNATVADANKITAQAEKLRSEGVAALVDPTRSIDNTVKNILSTINSKPVIPKVPTTAQQFMVVDKTVKAREESKYFANSFGTETRGSSSKIVERDSNQTLLEIKDGINELNAKYGAGTGEIGFGSIPTPKSLSEISQNKTVVEIRQDSTQRPVSQPQQPIQGGEEGDNVTNYYNNQTSQESVNNSVSNVSTTTHSPTNYHNVDGRVNNSFLESSVSNSVSNVNSSVQDTRVNNTNTNVDNSRSENLVSNSVLNNNSAVQNTQVSNTQNNQVDNRANNTVQHLSNESYNNVVNNAVNNVQNTQNTTTPTTTQNITTVNNIKNGQGENKPIEVGSQTVDFSPVLASLDRIHSALIAQREVKVTVNGPQSPAQQSPQVINQTQPDIIQAPTPSRESTKTVDPSLYYVSTAQQNRR
jgi:hypothetical protein